MSTYWKFFIILLIGFANAKTDEQVNYDGAQLLRITNISSEDVHKVMKFLLSNYNGVIWTWTTNSIDVSFDKLYLNAVKQKMTSLHYNVEVIIKNVQHNISAEQSKRINRIGNVMNWDDYQGFETINTWLQTLKAKYPALVEIITIGKTHEKRDLKVIRITNNLAKNSAIWIDGGIHAREWISPAVVTYSINQLLLNFQTLPSYMTDKTWYILPVMNADGYEFSRNSNRLWRKNRRPPPSGSKCYGVDLNRNWNVDWNNMDSQSDNTCDETYRGPKAFSEPESIAVSTFLYSIQAKLKSYLTFHSYGQYILYPFGFKEAAAPDADQLKAVGYTAAVQMKRFSGTQYTVGQSKILGLISGASDDWAKVTFPSCKYAYTIELRDRGNYGFILPQKFIKETGTEGFQLIQVIANAISNGAK